MLVDEDMEGICRLWIVAFYEASVLHVAELETLAGLADVHLVACYAR
jgi:hypothetical protein